ncbi:class I SAM-dependent methyltransferase [Nocardia sp. NBC_01329]|uniref:class I SAM-dependent methyltransferase n=1 Tax=Nocardia sp. NBC_01329 TaxID=2903594 RepID=UPI002E145716|nr:methyltransferase domain-containing protein [Nocardia sp. NBC_01329]
MDQQFWDDMYSGSDQHFSGLPNDALVTEVTGMTPGRVLDLGCGEGADAYWLAEQGWQVTAVDISQVALDRAGAGHPEIAWQRADITVAPMPAGSFDLVSAHYFPIAHQSDHATVRGLLEAVAPEGTLLFVSHDPTEFPPREENPHGFDPYDFYQPSEIAGLLGDEWTIEVEDRRDRNRPAAGHQIKDLVLRARRAG